MMGWAGGATKCMYIYTVNSPWDAALILSPPPREPGVEAKVFLNERFPPLNVVIVQQDRAV